MCKLTIRNLLLWLIFAVSIFDCQLIVVIISAKSNSKALISTHSVVRVSNFLDRLFREKKATINVAKQKITFKQGIQFRTY